MALYKLSFIIIIIIIIIIVIVKIGKRSGTPLPGY